MAVLLPHTNILIGLNVEKKPWNNGNRDPRWGVAELQKMSPPTTVGDAADMQLPFYQTRESPSSGKCSIFCYRLTYISKMYSMHTKQIVSNPPEKSHRCEAVCMLLSNILS